MNKDLQVFILKDEAKDFKAHHVSIDKFNENYHKYVGNEHNKYFIIPVSTISNIFMILDIASMPKIFNPIKIKYDLEVLSANCMTAELATIYKQPILTEINKPHDLFTFIYSLSELTSFNTLFNDMRNDSELIDTVFAYNIYNYEIISSDGVKKDEIFGIPALISSLEKRYFMSLTNINSIECVLNGDGSCAYSDTSQLNANSIPKMIGNTRFDGTRAFSMTLPHNQVPVYTFLSYDDTEMIEDVNEFYYRGNGIITYYMGTPLVFKTTDRFADSYTTWNYNENNFATLKSSTTHINSLIDYVIYLKMAPSILRVAYMLTQLDVKDPITGEPRFADISPCFRYEFNVISESSNKKLYDMCNNRYIKDYIINAPDFFDKFDPYADFIKDIEDIWIPF
jgi:hypothetical protein